MEIDIKKLYEVKHLNYFENIEYEFSKNFVKYIKNYNQIDKNIGITIALLVSTNDHTLAFPMISKLTTHNKMCVLKEIVRKKFYNTNPNMVRDYNEWLDKASKSKTERNQYIHGCWQLAGCLTERPIIFSPINWDIGKIDCKNQNFSLEEFKSIADELENISLEFGELRKKYPF
jgi:hypothetical protein